MGKVNGPWKGCEQLPMKDSPAALCGFLISHPHAFLSELPEGPVTSRIRDLSFDNLEPNTT